ncbi:MAG TPA: hypothetical protein VFX05_09910 [Casimicrobiaceae bacterium]|nr:hypothetical protein [Casimicrobiaceae bacterium]
MPSIVPSANALGVTVMPEWFACEGVDAVLDRVGALGATSIATSPYVLEPAADGEGGREPPIDAGAGRVRPLDRPLFGRRELWVRTAPAFVHERSRYAGLVYQPSPPTALTLRDEPILDRAIERAKARGIEVLLQVMAASPPGYRVQFSGARDDDQCLGPDRMPHPDRVDRNASLASPHVVAYVAALVAELAERYPDVAGFRLDWPEYPPYDFASALFDFHPAACALMAAQGHDPDAVAREVRDWRDTVQLQTVLAAQRGAGAVRDLVQGPEWRALWDDASPIAPLFAAKRAAVVQLLAAVRDALDRVPGRRRRLEVQAFPPPFHRISGFPLRDLRGVADAVGIKLYTMHWPMIARFWAAGLVGAGSGPQVDAAAAALAMSFGFTDGLVDGAALRYPEPDQPHPVSAPAQRAKLDEAQREAGSVPVIAFVHSYGPLADVVARFHAAAGWPRWINRYGYLSDAKIDALAAAARERPV